MSSFFQESTLATVVLALKKPLRFRLNCASANSSMFCFSMGGVSTSSISMMLFFGRSASAAAAAEAASSSSFSLRFFSAASALRLAACSANLRRPRKRLDLLCSLDVASRRA